MDTDVIVVGAGPTGLMLAAELALGGASVLMVEALPERSGQSKALGVQPRTAEVLELRGLLEPLLTGGVQRVPGGHFAGMRLDFTAWDTAHPYMIGTPQSKVERVLEGRVRELGVRVLRGQPLVELWQDDTGVSARLGDGAVLRGAWLAGCDGGRSTVRTLLGVDFPGLEGRQAMAVADIRLAGQVGARWRLPEMTPSPAGRAYLTPLEDGVHRILFYGPEQQDLPREAPVTEQEVGRALMLVPEPEARLESIVWASRFSDASRQVEDYRHGRVLLAGDAAHIHSPMGGQGLNLGVQDSFNLGWKLAAQVRGHAPAHLLDTYNAERHPVAARVLANTRAQSLLLVAQEEHLALREIVAGLLAVPEANAVIAGMISGLDIGYELPGPAHPLLGRRLPGAGTL
ncbi:FAD-dependent monooxygenase, partial [Spirillospora sp. NPDC049652]